jgi:hypothetical protein
MSLPDDLTTLQNLQTYLGIAAPPPTDEQLAGMISRVSGMIRAFLARPSLTSQTYTRLFDGTGTGRLMLPDWPVTAVSSLIIGARTYTQAPNPGPSFGNAAPLPPAWGGYRFAPWDGNAPGRPVTIELLGPDLFCRDSNNVLVTYTAGYLTAETWAVPAAPGELNLLQPRGIFAADAGVAYAGGGAALTAMPAGSALAAGQYIAPSALQSPPVYAFAAADAGKSVVISYSFVPGALEQACLDAISALYYPTIYGAPSNIHTLKAGQSEIQFTPLGTGPGKGLVFLTPGIEMTLQPFRRVAPV